MELLGPEYSPWKSTPWTPASKVFLSREVTGDTGEDLVEKQNAETGVMPDRGRRGDRVWLRRARTGTWCSAFREGRMPDETFADGLAVTELLMTAYMSAEQERTIPFPPPDLETFVPAVARGEWNPGRE